MATTATCRRGHVLDEANLYVSARGHRNCRSCNRTSHRASYPRTYIPRRGRLPRGFAWPAEIARADRQRFYNQVSGANKNARGLGNPDRLTIADVVGLPESCEYCGSKTRLTLDHRTPLVRGGANARANLAIACASCNSHKHNRTAAEFIGAAA